MANPALFTAQAGSDQIHPLTQLALQPVEQRNAATSSLCDIPHTIMHGPSSASHVSLNSNLNHMGWKWKEWVVSQGKFELDITKRGLIFLPSVLHKVPIIMSLLIEFMSNLSQGVRRGGYCYYKSDWRNRER